MYMHAIKPAIERNGKPDKGQYEIRTKVVISHSAKGQYQHQHNPDHAPWSTLNSSFVRNPRHHHHHADHTIPCHTTPLLLVRGMLLHERLPVKITTTVPTNPDPTTTNNRNETTGYLRSGAGAAQDARGDPRQGNPATSDGRLAGEPHPPAAKRLPGTDTAAGAGTAMTTVTPCPKTPPHMRARVP